MPENQASGRADFLDLLEERFEAAADEYIELRRQIALVKADIAFRGKHIQLMKKFLEQAQHDAK
jgi:hypothetical protein